MNQQQQFANALSQLKSGNVRMAVELCELGLKRFPGDGNFLVLSARANLALRKFARAGTDIEEAIRLYPDFAGAHETYGDLLLVRGDGEAAVAAYETALRLDPTNARVHDKIERARQPATQPVSAAPASAATHASTDERIRAALEFERSGDLESAESICREVLTANPENADAARLLAAIAVHHKRFREAEVFLKKAVSVAPDFTRAWVDLAGVQRELEHFDDAIASAREVLRLAPDNAESYVVFASAIGTAGDHEEAIRAYARALELAPERPAAACGMAHHQKTLGDTDAAIASYRRAITLKPDHAEAYWSLANLKTFRFADREVEAMEALLGKSDLADDSRAQLNNALGLEYEGRGEHERAFERFRACNAVRRRLESYDPMETESTCDRIIDTFTDGFLARHSGSDALPVTPIFVVGLPRSGSTLIEQILASHSKVDGTHELSDLSRTVRAAMKPQRSRFPDALATFGAADFRKIGEAYLARTAKYRQGAPYFIDKNPNNFVYAGVLALAIPNAKIIDATRHPLDSCLGSYKQLFASGQPFTYDATELAEYYLQYRRLMDHWRAVLPGFVLEVRYESVVSDLEREVRRMLDFCGLPFEPGCLRFHETRRAVKTASSEQVRQPIYSSSVHLFRNYEPYLREFIEVLAPLLEKLPASDRPGDTAAAS